MIVTFGVSSVNNLYLHLPFEPSLISKLIFMIMHSYLEACVKVGSIHVLSFYIQEWSEKVGTSEWLTVMLHVHTKRVKTKLL